MLTVMASSIFVDCSLMNIFALQSDEQCLIALVFNGGVGTQSHLEYRLEVNMLEGWCTLLGVKCNPASVRTAVALGG